MGCRKKKGFATSEQLDDVDDDEAAWLQVTAGWLQQAEIAMQPTPTEVEASECSSESGAEVKMSYDLLRCGMQASGCLAAEMAAEQRWSARSEEGGVRVGCDTSGAVVASCHIARSNVAACAAAACMPSEAADESLQMVAGREMCNARWRVEKDLWASTVVRHPFAAAAVGAVQHPDAVAFNAAIWAGLGDPMDALASLGGLNARLLARQCSLWR